MQKLKFNHKIFKCECIAKWKKRSIYLLMFNYSNMLGYCFGMWIFYFCNLNSCHKNRLKVQSSLNWFSHVPTVCSLEHMHTHTLFAISKLIWCAHANARLHHTSFVLPANNSNCVPILWLNFPFHLFHFASLHIRYSIVFVMHYMPARRS